MKKVFIPLSSLLVFAIIVLNHQCNSHNDKSHDMHKGGMLSDCSLYILDSKSNPSPQLLDLLTATDVKHDGTLTGIVRATQFSQNEGGWLRTLGKERWEVKEVFSEKREQLMAILDKLGVIQEIEPTDICYDYAVILGATVHRVRSRLQHLVELWKKGVRFGSIVVLTGQRLLDPGLESPKELLNKNNTMFPFKHGWQSTGDLPTAEAGMTKLVFEQSPLPAEWDNLSITFIDTPKQQTLDGKLRRPNTQESIMHWLKTNPKAGSILAISNQPYVHYQDSAFRCFLPDTFSLETVGKAVSSKERTSSLLDNMARWLYQENKKRTLTKE